MVSLLPGLKLDPTSNDYVEGKVVAVSHDLYLKGCIQDVSEGIKVSNWLYSSSYKQLSLILCNNWRPTAAGKLTSFPLWLKSFNIENQYL